MNNWRDKSDRDNLVAPSSRSSDLERFAWLEKKVVNLQASQRARPSWLAFASVIAFSFLSVVVGFLALYNSELLKERLSSEIEARKTLTEEQIAESARSVEEQITDSARAVVGAIARIETESTISRRYTLVYQLMFQTLGYDIVLTGVVDQQTREATRAFQRDQGLVEDGQIGQSVIEALFQALQE